MYKKILMFIWCVRKWRVPKPLVKYITKLTDIPIYICPLSLNFISDFAFTKENGCTIYEYGYILYYIANRFHFPQLPDCYAPIKSIKRIKFTSDTKLQQFCEDMRVTTALRIQNYYLAISLQPKNGMCYFGIEFKNDSVFRNITQAADCSFTNCYISSDFKHANLFNCNFKYCRFDLKPHAFYGAILENCTFTDCVVKNETKFRKKYNVRYGIFKFNTVTVKKNDMFFQKKLIDKIYDCQVCHKKEIDYYFNHLH